MLITLNMKNLFDKISLVQSDRKFFWSFVFTLSLVLFCYAAVLDNYFSSDDFLHLAVAMHNGLSWKGFLVPSNEHFQPVFRAVFALQFHFFKTRPMGYYSINLLCHLINVALVIVLFSRICTNRIIGIYTGMLFGISFSHWRVTMWISTQGQLLATSGFLAATLFFINYLEKRKKKFLVGAVLSHLFMLFSFTAGLEVPLLYCVFLYAVDKKVGKEKGMFWQKLLVLFPFIANVGIYFLCRWFVFVGNDSFFKNLGGAGWIVSHSPMALWFILGGIYDRLLRSFTGVYFFNFSDWVQGIYVASVFVAVIMSAGHSRGEIKKYFPLIICFILWVFLIYFLPVWPRLSLGFEQFVSKARYAYLPSIPASAVIVMLVSSMRVFTSRTFNRWGRWFVILFILFVGAANIREIRMVEVFVEHNQERFDSIRRDFLGQLKALVEDNKYRNIKIVDRPLYGGKSDDYSGWNVLPSLLVELYCPQEYSRKIEFIESIERAGVGNGRPVYQFSNGRLERIQ